MPQSVFNRYEKKYLMPERVYQELRGRLAPYMQVDFYGLHTIVHFDDVAVYRHLAKIAEDRNTLIFRFKDGKKAVKRWQDRSRAESWTPEMKEAARQKAIERNRHNG